MQKHEYINTPEADDIRENFKSAELNRLRLAAGSVTIWSYVGVLLSAVFLIINSAQAYWALNHLAGLATDSPINAIVTGLIACISNTGCQRRVDSLRIRHEQRHRGFDPCWTDGIQCHH